MADFFNNLIAWIKKLFVNPEKTEEELRLDTFFDREQKFKAYNTKKLDTILDLLSAKKREVYKLIPVLLSLNDKALPGYIYSRNAIHGISKFTVTAEDKRLIQKYFKKPNIRVMDVEVPAVESLALIGSTGSIAQTESSDFDFWVCTTFENFSDDQLAQFRTKLEEIEKWAIKAAGLEVHFFLMDISSVHANDFGETGGESSGTALSKLLKEEFYRTASYICGKLPYWCIMHPEADDETYENEVSFIRGYNHFSAANYINIGNVYSISKDEFFGAALWEIVKGWQFPFKSILKMALLEKYISSDLTSGLLCNNLKEKILDNPLGDKNDPYLMLFDSIHSFYKDSENTKDLEMIKTCFYIKTSLKGSEILNAKSINSIKDSRTQHYYKIAKSYIDDFNWDVDTYKHLEAFDGWTVKATTNFLSKIDNSMLNMYKRIMKIVKIGESIVISDTDLTIIGRKIQSIFRILPNKIPFIAAVQNTGNVGSIVLHEEQKDKWNLHFGTKKVLNPILASKDIVYSADDIFEIIGWIALNKYYREDVYIFVKSTFSIHTPNELKQILKDLQDKFFPLDIYSMTSEDLLEAERVKKLYIIPNYAKEISSMIDTLHIFYLSSWGEFFYRKFEGATPTMYLCNSMLANSKFDYELFNNNTEIYVPKKVVGIHTSANKKLSNMFSQMTKALNLSKDKDVFSRFLTIIDDNLAIFYLEDGILKLSYFKDIESLYNFFEMPTYKRTVITAVDDYKRIGHLKIMCERAKYGQVNIMLAPKKGNQTEIIIVDEIGNIHHFGTYKNMELPYSLAHLAAFIENTLKKSITRSTASPFYRADDIPIKYFKISSEGNRFYALDSTKIVNQQIQSLDLNPSELKVTRGINKKGDEGYIISLDNDIVDDSEYPDILAELMRRIKIIRDSKKGYGIFITEVSLDSRFQEKFCPTISSLSHYLIYKGILESKLRI